MSRHLDDTFVCPSCEASETPIKGKHKPMHGLVLCQPPREALKAEANEAVSVSLGALETKFDEMQRAAWLRLETLENKIDALAVRIDGAGSDLSDERGLEKRLDMLDVKMQRIEDMLGVLLTKLG